MKNTGSRLSMNQPKKLKEVDCDNCGLYRLCQIAGLDADESALDSVVERRKKIANADYLYRAGDRFSGVFAVKSGIFKSISYFDDGREQIIDFHLPGELIGLEAIDEGIYLQSVIALENSSVCDMDFAEMEKLEHKFIAFQGSVIHALSRKVRLDQYQSLLIGAQSAEQRLAIFLISIFSRLRAHDMQAHSFRMPMRKDIANYLGLALETVGRVLKRFEESKLIESKGRHLKICNYSEIQQRAGLIQYDAVTKVA
ncbi:MAG: cyclic nucleotide-binding domain-containing protein [Gammaproteobacteria bacterium]|nr:cyclic nucleotide-binding domain-containing protein [Gammaproteobacteria bacterium]